MSRYRTGRSVHEARSGFTKLASTSGASLEARPYCASHDLGRRGAARPLAGSGSYGAPEVLGQEGRHGTLHRPARLPGRTRIIEWPQRRQACYAATSAPHFATPRPTTLSTPAIVGKRLVPTPGSETFLAVAPPEAREDGPHVPLQQRRVRRSFQTPWRPYAPSRNLSRNRMWRVPPACRARPEEDEVRL